MDGGLIGPEGQLKDAMDRKVIAGCDFETVDEPQPERSNHGIIYSGVFLCSGCGASRVVGRLSSSFGDST